MLSEKTVDEYFTMVAASQLLSIFKDDTLYELYFDCVAALVEVLKSPRMRVLTYFDEFVTRLLDVMEKASDAELIQYLPLYSEKQRHRHDVRPGLSGYAQVNGRNSITWTHKFELDCEYVDKITFLGDLKILFQTVEKAFIKQEGISSATSDTMEDFDGTN